MRLIMDALRVFDSKSPHRLLSISKLLAVIKDTLCDKVTYEENQFTIILFYRIDSVI